MYLYNLEVCEEDAFLRWREDVTDAYPGKGEALFQVSARGGPAVPRRRRGVGAYWCRLSVAGEHVADVAAAAGVRGRGGGGLGRRRSLQPAPSCTAFISRSSHINIIKPNS